MVNIKLKIYYTVFFVLLALFMIYFVDRASKLDMNQKSTYLVLDEVLERTLPRNFRTYTSDYLRQSSNYPSQLGLKKIKFIASGQFSEESLKAVLSQYKEDIWVIDLRRESHGFVNGRPISWYAPQNRSNEKLTSDQIERLEQSLLQSLKQNLTVNEIIDKKDGVILEVKPHVLVANKIESEKELTKRLGLHYIRLPITDHHRPSDADVDIFIKLLRKLPDNTILYFHCRAGKGRTTTFITLWDMLLNSKKLSYDEIINRQYLLGGAYLLGASNDPEKMWKATWAKDRQTFLTQFYHYAQQADYHKILWSEWLTQP